MPVGLRLIESIIDIPPHCSLLPIKPEDMEIIGERAGGEVKVCALVVAALYRITIVEGAIDLARFMPEQFNNIDLAAVGPAAAMVVRRQHRHGRPESFSLGQC